MAAIAHTGLAELGPFRVVYPDRATYNTMVELQFHQGYNDFTSSRPNPYILDCGANIGVSVLRYKSLYPQARIVAFEPDPDLCGILRHNIDHNALADVTVVEAAVWHERTRLPFLQQHYDKGRLMADDRAILVEAVALGDYLTEPVDLVKLDIEGAEFDLFQHLSSMQLQQVRNLIVEIHHRVDYPLPMALLLKSLAEARFRVAVRNDRNLIEPGRPFVRGHNPNGDQFPVFYCWRD